MDATEELLGLCPSCQFDSKADGELGELQHVREAELVRGVVPANGEISQRACGMHDSATYSFVLWIFLLLFSKRLSDKEVSRTLKFKGTQGPYRW